MRKIKVSFYLRSGQVVTIKCKDINIQKNGNELVGYSVSGIDKSNGDPTFYLRIDAIDYIKYERVWF